MRFAQTTLFTGVAMLALVAAPQAADLQYSTLPAASHQDAGLAIATDRWSGLYAGVTAGGRTAGDFGFDLDDYGLTAGGQVGYLQQLGMFVVGAEVQGLWSDELYYALTPDAGLTQNWSVAAKGRAGVALGDLLVYGTGGAVLAELSPAGTTSSGSKWQTGAVFGGGLEHRLGDNLSVRAEYLQTRLFDVESAVAGVGRSDNLTNHSVTLGLNYRF